MKVTLGELQGAMRVMDKILGHQLDVKTAYWLRKGTDKLSKEASKVAVERNKLFIAYGEPDPTAQGRTRVKEEHMPTFMKEMDALLATEIELDFAPVDLTKLTGIKFSALEIGQIEKFVDASSLLEEISKEEMLKSVQSSDEQGSDGPAVKVVETV